MSVDRRTVIVPELPNISYDLYKCPPPSPVMISTSLYNILVKQNIELIDIIGHSYGTNILNIFQIQYPHMCNYKTYAEPACFNIHQTHIPTKMYARNKYTYIYKDIYTQYILGRCIFYEHTIIKNFDDKTTIILAKDDTLIPSSCIQKYITTHYPQVRVEMIEGKHGAYLCT
jgi:hypothetical protein